MALARVKTWIAGEVLTAADLNAEFNNPLNNALTLISPLTGSLDANGNEVILDTNGDSSITADTDDQIDVKTGGTDRLRFTNTLRFLQSTLTLSTGAVTGTLPYHVIAAESGTSDDFDTLTATNYGDGDVVWLEADSGDSIYVTTAGNFAETCMLLDGQPMPFMYDGTNWNLMQHGWIKQDELTASASSSLDFLKGFGSSYDSFMLKLSNILPASDGAALYLRISDDGSTFEADATDYEYNQALLDSNAAIANGGTSQGAAQILLTQGQGNAAGEGASGTIHFWEPDATSNKVFDWKITLTTSAATPLIRGCIGSAAHNGATVAILGVQVIHDSGNIASGSAALYALKK